MSFMPSLISFVPQAEITRQLPMPNWMFGLLAFAGFLIMLGILWSFRNTAAKTGQGHDAHADQDLRS